MPIKLNRLLLVNWYEYYQNVITFGDATLITGDTGAGKSVINDALMYIMVHNQKQFNKAGQTNGDRSLYGYVRGLVGDDKEDNAGSYMREEGCMGIIAAEFDNFIAGVCIEARNVKSQPVTFFTVEGDGAKLENLVIRDADGAVSKSALLTTKDISVYDTAGKYDSALEFLMKNRNHDVFKTMIQKSLAYQSGSTVDKFINDVLFQKDDINYEAFDELIGSLDALNGKVEENKQERKMLMPIAEAVPEYEQMKDGITIKECLCMYAEWQSEALERKDCENAISRENTRISDANERQNIIRKNRSSVETNLSAVNAAIEQEGGEELRKLKNEEKRLCEAAEMRKKDFAGMNSIIAGMKALLKSINDSTSETSARISQFICDAENREYLSEEYYKSLGFDSMLETENSEILNLRIAKGKCEDELKECEELLQNLKKGNRVSPKIYLFIKDCIRAAEKAGIEISFMAPLADLVTHVDDEWRTVLEAVLDGPKKTIIVNPEAYDFVSRFQERYHEKNIRIFDTESMPMHEGRQGTLKEKISSDNPHAEKVLCMLLGDITICDINTIRREKYGITQTGIIRKNYQQWALPLNSSITLGKDSHKIMMRDTERNISRLNQKIKKYADAIGEKSVMTGIISKRLLNPPSACLSAGFDIRGMEKQIEKIKYSIKELETGTLINYMMRKDTLENELKSLNAEYENLYKEKGKSEKAIKDAEDRIAQLSGSDAMQRYMESDFDDGIKIKAEKEYSKKRGDYKTVASRVRKEIQEDSMHLLEYFNTRMLKYMCSYNMKFADRQFGETSKDIGQYLRQYELAKSQFETEFQRQLEKKKEETFEMMKTQIFASLSQKIDTARQLARNINSKLKNHHFGDDCFEIRAKTTTNEKFLKVYKAIEAVNSAKIEGIEHNQFMSMMIENDPETKKTMDDFMHMFMETDERTDEFKAFLDYRNYFDFDIIVDRAGTKISMKKKSGSDSGGQFQTPYYAILAAGFQTAYSPQGLNIIIIDEAFNRMDAERIKEMMTYLNKTCGFQVIITSPKTSANSFAKKVDTIITVRSRNHVASVKEMVNGIVQKGMIFYGKQLHS